MAQYAGESLAKKVVRVRLYKRAREALKVRLPSLRDLKALFLIGDTASEVGALRHILGVRPENLLGIDRNAAAVAALHEKEPKAVGLVGDLADGVTYDAAKEFAMTSDGFHFMHLDLMGNLPNTTANHYGNWGNITALDGVCGCTFLRGREPIKQQTNFIRTWAKECVEGKYNLGVHSKVLAADEERASAHFLALQMGVMLRRLGKIFEMSPEEIKDPHKVFDRLRSCSAYEQECLRIIVGRFYPIASHSYRAEVSPMGVVLAQKTLFQTRSPPEHYLSFVNRNGRLTSSVIRKDPMEDLLLEADSLEKEFSKQQVAEILDVSTGTLAAWRAHRTMGTYDAA